MSIVEPILDEQSRKVDVVIVGTGLTECMLGAALSAKGKKVLQLDSNSYYGGSSASLSLRDLQSWAAEEPTSKVDNFVARDADYADLNRSQQWYMVDRCFEMIDDEIVKEELRKCSSRFAIDLNPRILYCKSKMVDLLLESGCAAYLEFQKLKDSLMIWTGEERGGNASGSKIARSPLRVTDTLTVPVTRQQIFKHKKLSLLEKRQLMKFITTSANLSPNLAFQSAAAVGTDTYNSVEEKQDCKILQDPVSELDLTALPSRLLDGLKYAVCLDLNEDNWRANKSVRLQNRLTQFVQSLQVYDSDGCAFLLPSYGTGDIVQAFARRCSVESGLYVLRCTPSKVRSVEGMVEVTTEGGQVIRGHHAVISPDYLPCDQHATHTISWRAVFCTDKPLLSGGLPYRLAVMSLPSSTREAPSVVSVLQTTLSVGVDKKSYWVTYFSEEGKEASSATLERAAAALLDETSAVVLFKLLYRCIGNSQEETHLEEVCPNVFKVPHVEDFNVVASDDYAEDVMPRELLGRILGEDDDGVVLFDKAPVNEE